MPVIKLRLIPPVSLFYLQKDLAYCILLWGFFFLFSCAVNRSQKQQCSMSVPMYSLDLPILYQQ